MLEELKKLCAQHEKAYRAYAETEKRICACSNKKELRQLLKQAEKELTKMAKIGKDMSAVASPPTAV